MNLKKNIILGVFLCVCVESASSQTQDFKDYYANGKVRSEGSYERGYENGLWKYYYEDGTLQEETNYFIGKLNGSVRRYHPNGKLMNEGYFTLNKQDSIMRAFSDSTTVTCTAPAPGRQWRGVGGAEHA